MNTTTTRAALTVTAAAAVLALTGCSGSAATPPAKTVTATATTTETVSAKPVTVTKVQEKAPKACLDAIDAYQGVMDAVATEHEAIGTAAGEAADTGDVMAFLTGSEDAVKKMTGYLDSHQAETMRLVQECRDAK